MNSWILAEGALLPGDSSGMKIQGKEAEHWGQVARGWSVKGYSNELLAEHKRKTYISLIARWAEVTSNQQILKTDLFAEAFELEQFLFDIAPVNSNVVGIDISTEIVALAKRQALKRGIDASQYLCSDVKKLPLRDSSIDLIISDSTLDHFPSEADIVTALKELGRVLRDGGILILTIDNKSNLTYPPYFIIRLWMKLGLSPYFIGRTFSLSRLRRALKEIELIVEANTAILHYPHPDGLVRWLERSLRKLSRGKLDNAIRKGLDLLDRLEGKRTRYLTGRYLAVKAVKRGAS
jgi:SAM-dependent methyltransferase